MILPWVFTQSITDGVKQKMILAIMSLVSELNRTVIFEGVETEDEYNFIESHNEDYQIQGWYFYKSLSLQELQNALVGNDNAQTL
jgi:EAL domain-containing protein (putative c-di-GMP-specific phosphodiesterase class I)